MHALGSARRISVRLTGLFLLLALAAAGGCKSAYYSAWEKLGYAKRDILVSRVKDARDDQEEAKEQFKTTLQKFQEVTGFSGGDLEAKYKQLNSEYEQSVDAADSVRKRITSVETVANDLFAEWEKEITQYSNAELRQSSERQLGQTRAKYNQFLNSMKAAEAKMTPVLAAFNDQVLFLKHNLNAKAIASLQSTTIGIETDVARLIKDMEASIAEANAFIGQMKE